MGTVRGVATESGECGEAWRLADVDEGDVDSNDDRPRKFTAPNTLTWFGGPCCTDTGMLDVWVEMV